MTLVEFMIRDGKLLTNAHCLQHDTPVYFFFFFFSTFLIKLKLREGEMIESSIWLRFDPRDWTLKALHNIWGKLSASLLNSIRNKLKLALTSISRDELHSRVSLLVCLFLNYFFVKFLFSNQNKTNTPTQIKTRQIHISCALPLTKGPQPNQPILSFTTSIAVYLLHPFLHLKVSQETFSETHSQKERKKSMGVSLFVGFTLLSLCLPTSTSELLQFQLSTISAAPSFLPEAPSSFSASPPEATSPDISPLFPTPGSSEMSPSPSESSAMPTIPSSP
ncbi:unnamed protein product [Brassica rapa subsp. narinosa]